MLLATYNIQFGVGRDGRYDLDRIAREVEAADIVCFQEVVQGWPQNGHADQAAELAQRLNRYYVFHAPFDTDGSSVTPEGRIVSRRRTFGNMVASRWPIRSSRAHRLPYNPLTGPFDLQRGVLEAVIDAPGLPLRVYSLHLSHISPVQRRPQVEELMRFVAAAPAEGTPWHNVARPGFLLTEPCPPLPGPAVLMGDFNLTPDEPEYALLAGTPHEKWGWLARADQYADAWRAAGNAEAESFPGEGRIDHCFLTPDLAPRVRRAWIDQQAAGSDHWPLFVELDCG